MTPDNQALSKTSGQEDGILMMQCLGRLAVFSDSLRDSCQCLDCLESGSFNQTANDSE
jgi:hypothetical protein